MSVYRPTYMYNGQKKQSEIWWYSIEIGKQRERKSTYTKLKTLALKFEENRRRELERAYAGLPSVEPKSRIESVGAIVKKYLEHYPINHRKRSIDTATERLAEVTRLLGSALRSDLNEDRIRGYIQTRLAEGEEKIASGKRGVGGRTINMEVGELSRALGHTWRELWPRVRKLEENHDIGIALKPEEETALLTSAATSDNPNRNPSFFPLLCVAFSTGMRFEEITRLRWSHIDFEFSLITVDGRSRIRSSAPASKSKTRAGTGRQIPFDENPDLRAVLDQHTAWYSRKIGEVRPEYFVFPGRGRPTKSEARPLNPSRSIGDITTAWDNLREKTGIECRFHDIRHTVCTKMAEAGVPESTMLALMGHISRQMLERYSHIRLKAKREAGKSLKITLPTLPKIGPVLVSPKSPSKGRQREAEILLAKLANGP